MKITPNKTLIVFGVLMFFPYLYPSEYFLYSKVFDYLTHSLICITFLTLAYLSAYFGRVCAMPFESVFFTRLSSPTNFLFFVSKIVIIISCLGNAFIAYSVYKNGLQVIGDFDLVAAKSQGVGIEGVAFLSQLYLFFLPYLIFYGSKYRRSWKLLTLVLLICVFLRSILYSERLALVEFLVFSLIPLHALRFFDINFKRIFLFSFGFLILFALAELSRQFYAQYVLTSSDIDLGFVLGWSVERYMAYYADTVNKLYIIIDNNLLNVTHYYLYPIQQISSKFGIFLLNDDFNIQEYGLAYGYIHSNFNNVNGLSILLMDYGYFGLLIFASIFFLGGFIFQIYIKIKDIVIFSLYPAIVITNLEFTRVLYFNSTRLIIPLMVFFVFLIINYFLYVSSKRE